MTIILSILKPYLTLLLDHIWFVIQLFEHVDQVNKIYPYILVHYHKDILDMMGVEERKFRQDNSITESLLQKSEENGHFIGFARQRRNCWASINDDRRQIMYL